VPATPDPIELRPIGVVESPLVDRRDAPRQGDEGAPDAWLLLDASFVDGLDGLTIGAQIVVVTWFDRADRDVLRTHPRDDMRRPEQGVFTTRSPDRPNPVGLHEVTVLAIEGARVRVNRMDALDGTPILDLKPVLPRIEAR
jgi:tRNA-Thr(GGU) m(6)t(6)A37 methyltransferase TsaA